MEKTSTTSRRGFLNTLGVAVGGAGVASAGLIGGARVLKAAQEPAKGKIPDTPFKIGHMTFLTGAAAVLGEPSFKGTCWRRRRSTPRAVCSASARSRPSRPTRAAGTDANVKELRRMKLSREDRPLHRHHLQRQHARRSARWPRSSSVLTMFVDGCTDFLFDKAVPNPKYVFRITNIQSADGITAAIGVAQTWPKAKQDRPHPSGLQLRPQRASTTSSSHREAGARDRDRLRGLAEARHHRLHLAHHQGDLRQARPARSPRCGAATTWPSTSRPCATACSRR